MRKIAVAALAAALLAAGCAGEQALEQGGGQPETGSGNQAPTVIIGSANFTEQLILANAYAELLESRGVPVERRLNLGSREVIFPALQSGELTLLPEYNGAALAFLNKEATASKPEEVTDALREALPPDLVALEPSQAQDKDALAVLPETAEKYDLQTYSDLARVADQLVAGGPPEEETREVGLPGLKRVYGIEFAEFRSLDAGGPLTRSALNSGEIDVARVFTTQGVIAAEGWVVLEDDKNLAPAQNIIPIIRKEALNPEIEEALNEFSAALTTEDLVELNKRVDVDAEDPQVVATDYLNQKGLI